MVVIPAGGHEYEALTSHRYFETNDFAIKRLTPIEVGHLEVHVSDATLWVNALAHAHLPSWSFSSCTGKPMQGRRGR
jgi:hypothetical protein